MQSEVNTINKQKFLAELGKLLTFMYEEDRQAALAMYNKMFEDAQDEQALLQTLVSPTRQAVVVARSYNAKERKLQVQAPSRGEEAAEERESTPDFVLAINQIYEDAVPAPSHAAEVLEDQFSLFEEDPQPLVEEDEDSDEEELFAEDAPKAEAPAGPSTPEEDELDSLVAAFDEAAAKEQAEGEEAARHADQVDEFLEDFSIENDELAPADEQPEPKAEEAQPVTEAEPEPVPAEEAEEEKTASPEIPEPTLPAQTLRKARPLLLILYILLAIPITLILVALLLVPTALALGAAVSAIAAGSGTLIAAFSGLPVFADVMIVLGAAIILLALGLLFLWLFIWFIGGAIVGLIRGVLSLGGKWCYKEVAA